MGKLVMLDRAAILGKQDIRVEELYIPEWAGTVRVKALNGLERDSYEQSVLDQRGKSMKVDLRNARAKLVSLALVDHDGQRLFTDDDVVMLGTKSAAAIDRIYDVASALAGISDTDLDELLGNSKSGQTDGSTSA